MKTAIFLGAGASASDGAPLQNRLFKAYFEKVRNNTAHYDGYSSEKAINYFFSNFFNIQSIYASKFDDIDYPTFEEVLGLLDIAENRKESFKGYSLGNLGSTHPAYSIPVIKRYIIESITKVLNDCMINSNNHHALLVKNLMDANLVDDVFFISTNYDLLIDSTIFSLYPEIKLDYGIQFENLNKLRIKNRPSNKGIKVLKLHGSINWRFCSTCSYLNLVPINNNQLDYFTNTCSCGNFWQYILVPPTFFKDMSNYYLHSVWNKTENLLNTVDHIIFCGYSFPDADIHIKYLFKRFELKSLQKIKITVINYHDGKSKEMVNTEKKRYRRFFTNDINYTDLSFEDFSKDPKSFI